MLQYVACTNDNVLEDATSVCDTPEEAINEWLTDWQIDQWRESMECCQEEDCEHFPEELTVHQVEFPEVRFPKTLATTVLQLISDEHEDMPENSNCVWPPGSRVADLLSQPLAELNTAIREAVLNYLKISTGQRTCPWWESVNNWEYVRNEAGEYQKRERTCTTKNA